MSVSPPPGKVAILSHVLPPSSSGQAVVLYRLLRDWDPQRYCLISTHDYTSEQVAGDPDAVTRRLPANYHLLPAEASYRLMDSRPYQMLRGFVKRVKNIRRHVIPSVAQPSASGSAYIGSSNGPNPHVAKPSLLGRIKHACHHTLQGWDDWVNVRSQVKQRAASIGEILRAERCTTLVVCSGDLIDMPAAFSAAERAGIPCYAYMLDDYPNQWVGTWQRKFAQANGRQAIQQAAGVIVPNEFLASAYRESYNVESVLVRNPVEDLPALPNLPTPSSNRPFRIVYTGMIYQAHFDAFIRLIQALERMPPGQAELHLYTKSDAAFLAENGIGRPAIIHASVTNAKALEIQRSADLLFLPLAFCSSIPEIIRTSAPGKMGEYLASGRPVLAHGPSDSFLSWYCRTHECAAVVDVPEVELLRRAIVDLKQDPALVDRIVQNAWQRANEDFHLPKVQRCFDQIFTRDAA